MFVSSYGCDSSGSTLPRVLPLCAPSRVEALFPHSTDSTEGEKGGDRGGASCLLSFLPGDTLSLLISEPRDGWHYGQNERTGRYLIINHQLIKQGQ